MVMETASQPAQSSEEGGDAAQPPPAPVNPRKRILEKSNFDDLGAPDNKKPAALSLSRLERYFTGPTPAASQVLQYVVTTVINLFFLRII